LLSWTTLRILKKGVAETFTSRKFFFLSLSSPLF
jgi:hypothetical protein